jgi:hypothetical protein
VSAHLVLDVPPAERAEHLHRLNGKALASLAPAVDEAEESRPVSRSWEELLAFTRITSRCLHCSFVREDVTLEEARAAFAAHLCDRPAPGVSRARRRGFRLALREAKRPGIQAQFDEMARPKNPKPVELDADLYRDVYEIAEARSRVARTCPMSRPC